ncbi:MAG: hypothetical protein R2862_12750 [Thermoanaerobaculia bacterium]
MVSAIVLARRHGLDQGSIRRRPRRRSGIGFRAGGRRADATTPTRRSPALAALRPPFFLWVHYYDPHEEYRPPAQDRRGRQPQPGSTTARSPSWMRRSAGCSRRSRSGR